MPVFVLKSVRVLGWFAVAAALGYVGWSLAQAMPALDDRAFAPAALAVLALCCAGHAGALVCLTGAWRGLIAGAVDRPVTLRQAIHVYGRANMAKYLPGNVFHYAGRQLLGRRYGWPQGAIALASVLEILLQCLAAAVGLMLYGVLLSGRVFEIVPWPVLAAVGLGLAAAPWLLPVVLPRLPLLRRLIPPDSVGGMLAGGRLARSFGLYAGFFVLSGLIMWLLYQGLSGGFGAEPDGFRRFDSLPAIATAYLAAWFVGFVTPGASGGIGVREAVLLLLLGESLGQADAVLLAVLSRLVTIGGDGLFFLASWRSTPALAADP